GSNTRTIPSAPLPTTDATTTARKKDAYCRPNSGVPWTRAITRKTTVGRLRAQTVAISMISWSMRPTMPKHVGPKWTAIALARTTWNRIVRIWRTPITTMVLTMPGDRTDPGWSNIGDDLNPRNRHDEFPATSQIIGMLGDDLVPEVPREDEEVIGALLHHALRRHHGNA